MIDLIRGMRHLAGAIALAIATPASAAPVLWTLSDVTFGDGGTAVGSFVYDADLNAYSSIDVTTTDGAARNGAHFTLLSLGTLPNATQVLLLEDGTGADQTNAAEFYMLFFDPLTNEGGTVSIVYGGEANCANATCSAAADPKRYLGPIGGSLVAATTTVPEPAGIALLLAGLAGLGIGRHRRDARA